MEKSKNKVRERRTYYGWSQRELARMVGITSGAMSAIERGVHWPGVDTAIRLSRALGTSVETLWGDGVEDLEKRENVHRGWEQRPGSGDRPEKERRKR